MRIEFGRGLSCPIRAPKRRSCPGGSGTQCPTDVACESGGNWSQHRQAERMCFRTWAQLPGAMSKKELGEVCLEAYMRMIFLADDPDPERIS